MNHPLVIGTYTTFLVSNSEMGKVDKLAKETKALKEEVKQLAVDVKYAKTTVSGAFKKADKAIREAFKKGWVLMAKPTENSLEEDKLKVKKQVSGVVQGIYKADTVVTTPMFVVSEAWPSWAKMLRIWGCKCVSVVINKEWSNREKKWVKTGHRSVGFVTSEELNKDATG
eukprot:949597-Ditylum_brightwellii.AAC.1